MVPNCFVDAFPTLFLPMELPNCPLLESNGRDENQRVLECLAEFLSSDRLGDSSFSVLKEVSQQFVLLHQKEGTIEGGSSLHLSPALLKENLQKTKVLHYWGLWIREQNATLLVQRMDTDTALVLVWEVQCPNEKITGTCGNVVQALPRSGMKVSWEELVNSFELLVDLTNNPRERALPKSHKAGIEHYECRDVSDPLYVLDFLLCALGGEELALLDSDTTIKILNKKMRDEVRYSSSKYPWRRAPVWAAFKAVLHVVNAQATKNDLIYKLFIQNFLVFVLEKLIPPNEVHVSLSSLKEASMKVVRRLEKLQEGEVDGVALVDTAHDLTDSAVRSAMKVVEERERILGVRTPVSYGQLSLEEMYRDTFQTLPKSRPLLEQLVNIAGFKGGDISSGRPRPTYRRSARNCTRLRSWSALIAEDVHTQAKKLRSSLEKFDVSPQEFIGALHDVSEGVFDAFQTMTDTNPAIPQDYNDLSSALMELFHAIIDTCVVYKQGQAAPFERDVRGKSEAILLLVTVCVLIDQIACSVFSLLREHRLGVGSNLNLNNLFLTTVRQKQHLHYVEHYLQEREQVPGPPPLEGGISTASFSVRFASQDAEMKKARLQINQKCAESQKSKRLEKKSKQEEHDELMSYVNNHFCTCRWVSNGYHEWEEECKICLDYKKAKRIELDYYDKLLPESLSQQRAIVFDFMRPQLLVSQSDCWFEFARIVCREQLVTESDWSALWRGETRLVDWSKGGISSSVHLGSTRKKLSDSHYSRAHVTASSHFIVRNDFNTILMDQDAHPIVGITEWKWNFEDFTTVVVQSGPYGNLQELFNSFSHTENVVIALKSEASEEISLREFEAVGTLRAGPALQLVRLATNIAQGNFSFDCEEIVLLICCVMWQAGPPATGSWLRLSYVMLLQQVDYISDICKLLREVLDGCRRNWGRPNTLLNVLEIARMLLDHAIYLEQEQGVEDCEDLMGFCRGIAYEWIGNLMETSNGCTDDLEMQVFQNMIADIAAMGTLSFLDHHDVLTAPQDLALWTFFRAIFHDNYSPNHMLHISWRRPNLLHAMAIAEGIGPRLASLDERTKRGGLDLFLKMYWSSANNSTIEKAWAPCEACPGWYHAEFRLDGGGVCVIELDTCGGAFLVNGSPCTRLPKEISAHKVYRRYFGDAIFLVQPQGSGGFRTTREVQGFYYEFFPSSFNPEVHLEDAPFILKVKRDSDGKCTDTRALLLPHSAVEDDIPKLLSAKYSHWFVLTGELRSHVYFRSMCYNDSRTQDPFEDDEYCLNCFAWQLHEKQSSAQLLNVHARSFLQLYDNVFNRLSPASYVHVLVKKTQDEGKTASKNLRVTVQLPRLQNIRFDYDGSCIMSREYKLRVPVKQCFGTLYCLQDGLLLEDPFDAGNKLFICPHGDVSRSLTSVKINTEDLASPPFFVYEVLPELRCLHGRSQMRLEWLFLALLHAQTGKLQHDPFLGCTGSEQALSLLRSPRCTGDLQTNLEIDKLKEQYLPEIEMLVRIAKISPWRSDYHGMEDCQRVNRPALCAHPALAFMALRRINDINETLQQIGLDKDVLGDSVHQAPKSMIKHTGHLNARAYFLRREFYPKDACLTPEEEFSLFNTDKVSTCMYDPPTGGFGEGLAVARFIGYSSQSACVKVNERASLFDLLCNRETLVGGMRAQLPVSGFTGTCFDGIVDAVRQDDGNERTAKNMPDFEDLWMYLYRFAQKVDPHKLEDYRGCCNLLAWVGTEYPKYLNHICQLMVIAKLPTEFISPPTHEHYDTTNEYDYVEAHVTQAIEKSLEDFEEPEPHRMYPEYETSYREWQLRRRAHDSARRKTLDLLRADLLITYREGRSVYRRDVDRAKVSCPVSLAQAIQGLFDRWRQARELRTFLEGVTRAFGAIQRKGAARCQAFAAKDWNLRRVETQKLPSRKTSFSLKTSKSRPDFVRTKLAKAYLEMARTGKFEGAFRFCCESSSLKTDSSYTFIFDTTYAKQHPEYKALYGKMTDALDESWKLARTESVTSYDQFEDAEMVVYIRRRLNTYHTDSSLMMEKIWRSIEDQLFDPASLKASVGLWNAVTPSKVLADLFQAVYTGGASISRKKRTSVPFEDVCLAFAVCLKHVQRARRCLRLLQLGSSKYPHLARDLESTGCDNWNPKNFPEFLGFEVDNDINIRGVQAQVALEILKTSHGNRLLQLNMGEGKTAVIMPLVLCAAARGNNIVRATVLPSLFSTNAADWQHKLGGLLGRRIFTFCCRRDLTIENLQTKLMLATLERIKTGKHVVVTIPEHRLSLENKALDLCSTQCLQSNPSVGMQLLQFIKQLALHGREFLDESDEILSPKYQLIYTLGAPVDMHGGMLRWKINASVLQSVQRNAAEMCFRFPRAVEISQLTGEGVDCPWLRLLDSDQTDTAYNYLCRLVADDVLRGRVPRTAPIGLKMNPWEQSIWTSCVSDDQGRIDELPALPARERYAALILRGLLCCGVMKVMLQKRYRVEYGKHPTRPGYQMAVPFRAKDIAAEKTEFGHPDMALGLTFASYYQSGLSELELHKVFQKLAQMSEAMAISHYSEWVKDVPNVDGIAEYEGVNLQDPVLFREKLFPAFHRNVGCIDFYLCKLILPVQAKQFPYKLLATAGDLCRNRQLGPSWQAVTTGFSGTDDLSYVLPQTIQQKNLCTLAKTNGMQLIAILQPRNNHYHALNPEGRSGNSTDQILARLGDQEKRSNVVLDSGALVLHMGNAKFANEWLKRRPDMEACVFFEGDRVFYVTDTCNGRVNPFRGSPYADDMSKCLLYLDDVHTRGSDFALPLETRAIVTLGKGLAKDKFVQTCMRMRQLQSSQSVSFIAAPDVHSQLRLHFGKSLKKAFMPKVILDWTISNTAIRICDLLPYFINQGVSTMRKAAAFKKHYAGTDDISKDACEALASACIESEVLLLQEMYGHPRDTLRLPDIADLQLKTLPPIVNQAMKKKIRERVSELAPSVCRQKSLFDEEQERELENELEEERQIERPPTARPLPSKVSPALIKLLQRSRRTITGYATLRQFGFLQLSDIFKETSMSDEFASQLRGTTVFCTSDFISTVKGSGQKDPYVKRIQWVLRVPIRASAETEKTIALIIISNFEAESFPDLLSNPNTVFGVRICSFASLQRRGQAEVPLRGISTETAPACVHVIGGSMYGDHHLLDRILRFLAMYPPPKDGAIERWENLFRAGHIERNGFVPTESRKIVDPKLRQSPFTQNPVDLLVRFLSNIRHASDELANSPLGRLLGVSEIDGPR